MTSYLLVEHDNCSIKTPTFNTLRAALQVSDDVVAIVAGHQCQSVAQQMADIEGVVRVVVADNPVYEHQLVERVADVVCHVVEDASYLLAPATTFGKNLLPRIAAMKGVAQISDVIQIVDAKTFTHPIYAGNALETVCSTDDLICLTVRTTAFEPSKSSSPIPGAIESLEYISDNQQSTFVSQAINQSDRPELTAADIVISGGRGLQDKAGFERVAKIADRLGAAIGASRAAVDAEFAPNDMQVGQTGQVVAPKLYIALGISGAIQHLAGMKDSGVIVAINKDPDAPIFQIANYGLVADLNNVLPEWEKTLSEMGY